MSEVFTFGETMALMNASTPGPLAHVVSLDLGIGGAESNVAIALRRLGTSVAWRAEWARTNLGDMVLRELTAEGLELHGVRDTTGPTGLMIREHRTVDASRVFWRETWQRWGRRRPWLNWAGGAPSRTSTVGTTTSRLSPCA